MLGKLLRMCNQGTCNFAMENDGAQCSWRYGFEAERIACAQRQALIASSPCQGIVDRVVESLATAMPHTPKDPASSLRYITALGTHLGSRPTFHKLLQAASDQLTFVSNVAPPIYIGTGDGIRSCFCSHSSVGGQCYACSLLQRNASTLYLSRANEKATKSIKVTNAIATRNADSLSSLFPAKTPLGTLTGQELRHRAAADSLTRQTAAKRGVRAKQTLGQLKQQVQQMEARWDKQQDDVPELVKLFTMVSESGMRPYNTMWQQVTARLRTNFMQASQLASKHLQLSTTKQIVIPCIWHQDRKLVKTWHTCPTHR